MRLNKDIKIDIKGENAIEPKLYTVSEFEVRSCD